MVVVAAELAVDRRIPAEELYQTAVRVHTRTHAYTNAHTQQHHTQPKIHQLSPYKQPGVASVGTHTLRA